MDTIDKKRNVKELREMAPAGDPNEVFKELKSLSSPADNFTLQTGYASLFRSLNKERLALKKIRVAILANNTVAHLREILEFYMAQEGFAVDIYEADYGTLRQTVLNPTSSLYEFDPEITILFTSYRDIRFDVPYGSPENEVQKSVEQAVADVTSLWKALRKNSSSYIIQNNADLPVVRVFGNYEATALWSHMNLLRRFNLELSKSAISGVTLFDLDYLSSCYGKKNWQDLRYWYHSKHSFAFDAIGLVAHEMAKTISAIKGLSKKCIVVDLDNTIWGGIIADDGLEGIVLGQGALGEAFVDFQKYLLELKRRGIILAVCSKNYEDLAKEPFLKHPDMQLKLDDIMVFTANWENKADNIRNIAATLNIGLDSLVFIDDNPAERFLIRQILPEVAVPELPEDPCEFGKFLSAQSYFETIQFSPEDKQRNGYYRDNIKREQLQKQIGNLTEYLQGLEMESVVGDFDEQHLSRIVQLINKTNQFNLTTIRYTESEIKEKSKSDDTYCRFFKLRDRFGDNGLIAVVILEEIPDGGLFINSWLMSCRVLSRGMEEFICKEIISIARQRGCSRILGKYVSTKKNKLVANLYQKLGFIKVHEEADQTSWELELNGKVPEYEVFIKRSELESARN